jgi:serine/threonine protein kinase
MPGTATSPDRVLADLIEEFLGQLEAGESIGPSEFAARHPEHAAALSELLPALEVLADLGRSVGSGARRSDSGAALALGSGRLGDYRILREIGRGGMGIVYEAEQISLRRRVAVKVLPFASAVDTRQSQRFQLEAQAAAFLHHQHIVPVFAVGCERGVHYYAMQFIEGRSLADVIRELRQLEGLAEPEPERADSEASRLALELVSSGSRHSLPIGSVPGASTPDEPQAADESGVRSESPSADSTFEPATVRPAPPSPSDSSTRTKTYCRTVARLGMEAAEALEHAHQEGIVHRDIKPANLMIDVRGKLWITDFGLARFQADTGLTMSGDLLGTLRYMSPEQAAGQRTVIDHRTDLYSLAVTLYELLTLRPAIEGDRAEVLRRIAAEEPRPLRRINPSVPADLETILLKAMAKEPAARYASAQQMADELNRFLEDLPIRAKRPSLTQRLWKWGRRHRALVWSAAVSLMLLLATVVTSAAVGLWAVRRQQKLTAAALAAESRRRQQARQALDAMSAGIIEGWLSQQSVLMPEHKRFLEQALEWYEAFAADTGQEEEARAGAARAYSRVGDIQRRLGQTLAAEANLRRALTLQERLASDFPANHGHRQKLADCFNELGNLLRDLGRSSEREAAYQQALTIRRRLALDYPDVPAYAVDLGSSLCSIGILEAERGQPEAALSWFGEAIRTLEPARQQHSDPILPRRYLANSYSNLGYALRLLRRYSEAKEVYFKAVAIEEPLLHDFPGNTIEANGLGLSYYSLGYLEYEQGRLEAALSWYDKAIRTLEPVLQQWPRQAYVRRSLHLVYSGRAGALFKVGRWADALQGWDRALEVAEGPPLPRVRMFRAATLAHLGQHARATAEADELARLAPGSSADLYDLACVFALSSATAEGEPALCERYGARAVELLLRAVQTGYRDAAQMKQDADLDPIRNRTDFQGLIRDLAFPADPFTR